LEPVARKLAIVGLVILILLLVIPLGIGMAMGMCPDCSVPGSPAGLSMCVSLVAAVFAIVVLFARRIGYFGAWPPTLGVARMLERPPRPL
jgi:hypothetical protein